MASAFQNVDARDRLMEEYKVWEANHPQNFMAKPCEDQDGKLDLLHWKCVIPGPEKTLRNGAVYQLNVYFPEDYPYSPPKCQFHPPIFHPNVFPSGTVALSLIDKEIGWKPQTTLKEVLVGIRLLLSDPNFDNPAQAEAFAVHFKSKDEYNERIKEEARKRQAFKLEL